jgi:hypothetical protein
MSTLDNFQTDLRNKLDLVRFCRLTYTQQNILILLQTL